MLMWQASKRQLTTFTLKKQNKTPDKANERVRVYFLNFALQFEVNSVSRKYTTLLMTQLTQLSSSAIIWSLVCNKTS